MRDEDQTGAPIEIEDEALRKGFTQIPNALLQRTDLSPGAKLTYMALLSFAWQEDSCYPGQAALARAIGMSKRSVDRFVKELEDARLVSHQRRGLNRTNTYTLHRFDLDGIARMATPELPAESRPESSRWQRKNTQRKQTQQDGYIGNDQERYARSAERAGGLGRVEDVTL